MKMSLNLGSPVTPDASSSYKAFDAFQRSKVGSIRDNPKLSKIRQRFESGGQENQRDDTSSKNNLKNFNIVSPSYSAPCSLNFIFPVTKDNKLPLRNARKISSSSCDTEEPRRHSEGEVGIRPCKYPMRRTHNRVNSLGTTRECKLSSRHDSGTFSIATEDGECCSSDELSKSENKDLCISKETQLFEKQHINEENFTLCAPKKYEDRLTKSTPTITKLTAGYRRITDRSPDFPREKIAYSSSTTTCSEHKKNSKSPEHPYTCAIKDPKTLKNSSAYDTALRVERIAHGIHSSSPDNMVPLPVKTCSKSSPPSSCQKTPASPTTKSSQIGVKQNSVKNAVRLYEEMSCKNNGAKSEAPTVEINQSPKRTATVKNTGDSNLKRSCVSRRPSRRNSIRKSKSSIVRSDSKKGAQSPVRKKIIEARTTDAKHPTEDSGLGLSDIDDLNKSNNAQSIYQTLCGISHARNYDPYDRLNRIHDMVSRIHKGQLATCAACKAIPSNALRYAPPVAGISLLQVRCNEALPHHHPPCVCFSCQHSIFSCAQVREKDHEEPPESSLEYLSISDSPQSLYYNACCLEDTPSPETWRLARRKPVCERNGRVCVVNCGVDQAAIAADDFYEKLTEWQTAPLTHSRISHDSLEGANAKFLSGDSCDSDEGWVDITDSEEEKSNQILQERSHRSYESKSLKKVCGQHASMGNSLDNVSYNLHTNGCETMSGDVNISRVSSSEHLYETISDIEEQNRKLEMNQVQDPTLNNQVQSESTLDNEHDSGEWSTESPSPILDETCDACEDEKCLSFPSNTCPATRFTLSCELEAQESKSTFIKSMLGKKAVSPKKRRMSHFFVPWLVSNQEYGSPSSQSPKISALKKQNMRAKRMESSPPKAKRSFTKTKRSQSVPAKSCTDKTIYSTTGNVKCSKESVPSIETGEADESSSVEHHDINGEGLHPISQSNSFTSTSSTYVRSDQLQCSRPVTKSTPCISPDTTPVDVTVERVRWRSLSGDSEHSYILFQPIKEEDVPLYQFYERNNKERVALCRSPDSFSPIMWPYVNESNSSHDCGHRFPPARSQLSVVEQLSPDTIDGKMLWCELPEVKDSGILGRISAQELKLQEAVFELIQSQASYVRSLKVLYEYFILSPEFSETRSTRCVLSKHEHDVLFSDIILVKEVSEMLMTELTTRWSDGILIPDICDILYKHSTMTSFSVYVKYCSNRVYQEKTLKELKETRLCFIEVLRKLESNPACQGLSLESFLFLPMQHIARLPLLLDSIFRWLTSESPSYDLCKNALEAVHKTFMECNEGAKKMERLEEMLVLNKQLEFKECKAIPLISTSRWLLKKGEMIKLEFDKKTFGRSSRCVRIPLYFFLFNDFIVITKRKSEDCYIVVDYCQKEKIQASTIDAKDLPQSVLVPSTCRYLISLSLLCNHQGSSVEMILNCPLLSERTRWIEAMHPVPQGSSLEVWDYDCPQVQCVRTYIAQQPDELSLQESDVVTIQRKMNDGWYEGRRLRDGLQGWFPASYTMDIPCSRARASNLRQCYRLLMLSQKHHVRT